MITPQEYNKDIVGQIFGRWTVLSLYTDGNYDHRRWLCQCNCNKHTIRDVSESSLKRGSSKSCGCLTKEVAKEQCQKNFKKYNDYEIQEDYVIMYTKKNEMFLVDLDDFWRVKNVCWYKNRHGYLMGYMNHKNILLSRYIMNVSDEFVVDHKGGTPTIYDNRKNNLRITTISENMMNKRLQSNNTSGVVGVSWSKERQKWCATIKLNSKVISLGRYANFNDAVKVRKEAEEKYFGEYSYDKSQQSYKETL